MTFDYPTHSAYEIAKYLFALFRSRYTWDMNVRALTVRAVRLVSEDDMQLSFFACEKENEKREKMEHTAYELENKFGTGAVTFGSLMINEKLPDESVGEE